MVLNLIIGCGTPPLGLCLFIACGIARIPVEKGARAILPFLAAEIVVLLIITYIPESVLFIPRMLGYIR
jgi:TRAP-type C4-dicarboxylate transport system permease large subunit